MSPLFALGGHFSYIWEANKPHQMKINFYLKDKAAKASTLIYAYVSADSKRHKVSTGLSTHPRHWNEKKQRAKNSLPGQRAFNDRLAQIAADLEEAYNQLATDGQPISASILREVIRPKEESQDGLSFVEAIQQFIREGEATGKAKGTLSNHKAFLSHIRQFEASTKEKLAFERINAAFENRFKAYFIREHQSSQSTIAKQFKVLKAFMEWARKQGFHASIAYKDFKQREERATKITLTEAEMAALEACDFCHRPGLERVRDMFLFCCETSLRYSDFANLKPVNIQEVATSSGPVQILSLNMKKTGGKVNAPLSPLALELLKKYQDESRETCFPVISGQKMNDYIKEACQLAGIDSPVQVVTHAAGQRKEDSRPKYELVSNHTARRTFVTLAVQWGWTDRQIMAYTGHRSTREISTYREESQVSQVETALAAPKPPRMRVVKSA